MLAANDLALTAGGEPVAGIMRFHNALRELVARRGIGNDVSRYEAYRHRLHWTIGSRHTILAKRRI